jgi:hypothetical protein
VTALRRDRAVVLGGGIAGLLAARVLSDHFAVVELVDRGALDDSVVARRGTPQARHLHGLLSRGLEVLEDLPMPRCPISQSWSASPNRLTIRPGIAIPWPSATAMTGYRRSRTDLPSWVTPCAASTRSTARA